MVVLGGGLIFMSEASLTQSYPCSSAQLLGANAARYRGTSLIRNTYPVGPYIRPMHRVLEGC